MRRLLADSSAFEVANKNLRIGLLEGDDYVARRIIIKEKSL
jgi:hypothetical protein